MSTKHEPKWIARPDKSTDRYEVEFDENSTAAMVCADRFRYRVRVADWEKTTPRPWWAGLPSEIHPSVSESRRELSLRWGRNNPALFVDAVEKFIEEHPREKWATSANFAWSGSLTLVAKRRD